MTETNDDESRALVFENGSEIRYSPDDDPDLPGDVDAVPLWERLPPRHLTAREVAAALPEHYPGERFTVYALDPLDNVKFHRLLVHSIRWHHLALTCEGGEPFRWERIESAHEDEIPDGMSSREPGQAAAYLGFPQAEVAQFAYHADTDAGRRYLPDDATMYGYEKLDRDEALELRLDLAVEAGETDLPSIEDLENLFEAFGPAVEGINDALADMAQAFEPTVEAVNDAMRELTESVTVSKGASAERVAEDIEDLLDDLDPERNADPLAGLTHPNARCATTPHYASVVEFGRNPSERYRITPESLTVSVENELETEAVERLAEREARATHEVRRS